jgi:hypothetical protein
MRQNLLTRPLPIPTEAEIAYAAGLYEGEGTIWVFRNGRQAVMNIRMTDREPIELVTRILGGHSGGPYTTIKEAAYKPKYRWQVQHWQDIVRVCRLLRPWLGPRRLAQIDRVLACQPEHPRLTRLCLTEPMADSRGYKRHRRLQEKPCRICTTSWNLYNIRNAERRLAKSVDDRTSKVMSKTLDDARLSAVPMGPSAFSGSDPVS